MLDVQKLGMVHVRIVSFTFFELANFCELHDKAKTYLIFSMTKARKWAAGVYDPSIGFIVAGGWSDKTAEKTFDGVTFTRIGTLYI